MQSFCPFPIIFSLELICRLLASDERTSLPLYNHTVMDPLAASLRRQHPLCTPQPLAWFFSQHLPWRQQPPSHSTSTVWWLLPQHLSRRQHLLPILEPQKFGSHNTFRSTNILFHFYSHILMAPLAASLTFYPSTSLEVWGRLNDHNSLKLNTRSLYIAEQNYLILSRRRSPQNGAWVTFSYFWRARALELAPLFFHDAWTLWCLSAPCVISDMIYTEPSGAADEREKLGKRQTVDDTWLYDHGPSSSCRLDRGFMNF